MKSKFWVTEHEVIQGRTFKRYVKGFQKESAAIKFKDSCNKRSKSSRYRTEKE